MGIGLPKVPEEFHKIPDARLAIIGSMWHSACVNGMIERAYNELLAIDVQPENICIHRVPGSLEIPFAARVLFEVDPTLDAILAFGVVLKGITAHDDTVMHNIVNGFSEVTNRFGKPVINEVIGVVNIKHAQERSGNDFMNKGVEAVFATSELLHWLRGVRTH
ncbi:MAG: 6,7-dimethyl-8-ribityllumazine synthase [Candidatus Endonucleobacter sp. (ex Gigantidas childressi)]|nr:6,7-dimethyl-8-ribityllumazine synthase [Candidatus Endonucleobacter sp. (ex Gigantidas childressi)]